MGSEGPDWRRRGLCSDLEVDPDMWFSQELPARRFAQHLCLAHCPVLAECHKHLSGFHHRGVVVFGVIFSDREGVPLRSSANSMPCFLCHKKTKPEPVSSAFLAWR